MTSILFLLLVCEPIDPQVAAAIAVALLDSPVRHDLSLPPVRNAGSDLGSIPKRGLTDAEKDAAYLKENHWRLGPSSCQMLNCPVHRQWVWEPRPATWEPGRAVGDGGQATKVESRPPVGGPGSRPKDAADTASTSAQNATSANTTGGCASGQCQPRIRIFSRRR